MPEISAVTTTARVNHRWWRTATIGTLGTVLAAVALFGSDPATASASASASISTSDSTAATSWSRIDDHVRDRLAATETPGAALAVIEDGEVVHRQVFGADGRGDPVTPETPFLWGSLAKPVTGMAVMQLVDAGRVDLDTPVRAYLPWFTLADPEQSERITPRHLLTNTSGIPVSATATVAERYDNAPGALAAAAHGLADVAPTGPPGETYAYSSAGYLVLGALVEEVSGRPFGDYLHQEILDPLGMTHAVATEEDFERERVAPGHRYVFGEPVPYDAAYDTSGTPYGYVGGTVDDLSRFVLAELGGGELDGRRVLSAESTALTQEGHVESSADRYGLGWSVGTLDGTDERMVWHSGALPGYQAMIVMLPESDRAVVVLQNAFSMLRDAQFLDAAFGAAQLLSGAEPVRTAADPLALAFPWLAAGLATALLLCVLSPATRRLPVRRRAARYRARSRRRILLTTAGSVSAALALAAVLWWVLPTALGGTTRTALIWLPDLAWGAVASAALALLLAAERLALATLDLRRGPRFRRDTPNENRPD